ncbi:phosphatases II, partial [Morchella conica CCBAS932]
LQAAESAEILQTCGITDIISITSHRPRIPPNLGITKTHFRLRDNTDADLLSILPECIRRIEEVMAAPAPGGRGRERRVLVHCRMGISRSGGMVVAYAMKHANIPARLALEFVRSRRPIVNPNKAFMAQLTVWGECGYDTALLMPDMSLPEAEEQEEEGPSEEEMLQMALEMSLAASEPESGGAEALGETLAAVGGGRLVVVNPDRVSEAEVVMTEAEEGAGADVTAGAGAGANGADAITVIPAPHTAPQTQLDIDIDIEMTAPPNPTLPSLAAHPQSQEPTTPELLSQYDILTTSKPTPTTTPAQALVGLHPEARIQRAVAVAAAEEEWVVVTMEEGMQRRFEECVRDVGGVGR